MDNNYNNCDIEFFNKGLYFSFGLCIGYCLYNILKYNLLFIVYNENNNIFDCMDDDKKSYDKLNDDNDLDEKKDDNELNDDNDLDEKKDESKLDDDGNLVEKKDDSELDDDNNLVEKKDDSELDEKKDDN
jgi:hypothetical protein